MKDTFEFVQSYPAETNLMDKEMRLASDVWLDMISNASTAIDIGQFYINSVPGEPMEKILNALIKKGREGVKIRVILDKMMYNFYPAGGKLLSGKKNIQVRAIDVMGMTGGIMHAKYIIADNKDVFLGSQNFDWLSLTNIHEMGIRVTNNGFAAHYSKVFESDWELAKKNKLVNYKKKPVTKLKHYSAVYKGEKIKVAPVFSPPVMTPPNLTQELPAMVEIMKQAKTSVLITAMEYSPKSQFHKELYSGKLDSMIRELGSKGVNVKLMVADWCQKHPNIDYLKSLTLAPNVEVKIMSIPRLKDEYQPFSRVTHCKYMVVDKTVSWLGSSNWEPDYFYNSRNCSSIITGYQPAITLRKLFLNSWTSPYVYFVNPSVDYRMPEIRD